MLFKLPHTARAQKIGLFSGVLQRKIKNPAFLDAPYWIALVIGILQLEHRTEAKSHPLFRPSDQNGRVIALFKPLLRDK